MTIVCIGRSADGMVNDPVWKGEISVEGGIYAVRVYRPSRDRLTGKSVYFAETFYHGERIYVCDKKNGIGGTLALLRARLLRRIRSTGDSRKAASDTEA